MAIDTTPMPQPNAPTSAAPAAIDAPDVGTSDPTAPVAPMQASTAQPAMPKGSQVNTDPNAVPGSVEPHHGMLASIFQDLAGGQKTVWRQTDNGPVATKENLRPGEMARGILAAALTGLASGYAPEARGKGPGGAIAAGFQGEQEAQKTAADTAQKRAQQQFVNKNEADEMTMRKQQSALEQQRGIREMQEHEQTMKEGAQRLRQGDFTYSQDVLKADQEQSDRLALQQKAGMTPVTYADGSPIPEFNSGAEAMTWANANPKLALKSGAYYNIPSMDPATHRWTVMQVPKTWDDLQWLGVKLDTNGNPEKGKDGKMIPNGQFKVNGVDTAPGGMITQHQLYESQSNELGLQKAKVDLEDAKVRLNTATLGYKKDQRIAKAEKEFDDANGDPLATDPKTHEYIMSPTARGILSDEMVKKGALYNNVYEAAQKKIEELGGEPKAGAPQSDIDTYNELKQTRDEAFQNMHVIQMKMLQLDNAPNIADTLANQLYKPAPDGTFDVDKAVKSLGNVPSGMAQAVREKLVQKTTGSAVKDVLTDANRLQAASKKVQADTAGKSLQDVVAYIKSDTGLTNTDKERLAANVLGLDKVDTNHTLLRNRHSGETAVLPSTQIPNPNDLSNLKFTFNGQSFVGGDDWEVLGRGTLPAQATK